MAATHHTIDIPVSLQTGLNLTIPHAVAVVHAPAYHLLAHPEPRLPNHIIIVSGQDTKIDLTLTGYKPTSATTVVINYKGTFDGGIRTFYLYGKQTNTSKVVNNRTITYVTGSMTGTQDSAGVQYSYTGSTIATRNGGMTGNVHGTYRTFVPLEPKTSKSLSVTGTLSGNYATGAFQITY